MILESDMDLGYILPNINPTLIGGIPTKDFPTCIFYKIHTNQVVVAYIVVL